MFFSAYMDTVQELFDQWMQTLERIRIEQPYLYDLWKHYFTKQRDGLMLLSSQLNHVVETTEKKELCKVNEQMILTLMAYCNVCNQEEMQVQQ